MKKAILLLFCIITNTQLLGSTPALAPKKSSVCTKSLGACFTDKVCPDCHPNELHCTIDLERCAKHQREHLLKDIPCGIQLLLLKQAIETKK